MLAGASRECWGARREGRLRWPLLGGDMTASEGDGATEGARFNERRVQDPASRRLDLSAGSPRTHYGAVHRPSAGAPGTRSAETLPTCARDIGLLSDPRKTPLSA
ncbi:hypothetical protein NDU88_000788 [Pleurodeles waltl]|uniref:Uncharacterized protein n=1 Tax=Pleurodeles waltl TaxID=8319 RepID=A0AAV7MIJ0_PLEWA|nr:hypothetical protein NDU88_000788 [Pleurodeles waltl]